MWNRLAYELVCGDLLDSINKMFVCVCVPFFPHNLSPLLLPTLLITNLPSIYENLEGLSCILDISSFIDT